MTLEEKEKQANCLIIHQRCEININHHRCRGAFEQSGGEWKRTNREHLSNNIHEQGTICSLSCWYTKLWSCVVVRLGHHMPNHQIYSANLSCAVAELWDREQTGEKTSEWYKNVSFKSKKCWYCSKMTVELTPFCQGSKYWKDKKDLFLSHNRRKGRRERPEGDCIQVPICIYETFKPNKVFIITESHLYIYTMSFCHVHKETTFHNGFNLHFSKTALLLHVKNCSHF